MNIQKSTLSFNKKLVFMDHESFSATFELDFNHDNVLDACQHVIAQETAKQAHELVDEGKMDLLEAALAGLQVAKQIENEAEVFVYTPDINKILEYTKAFISSVANKNWAAIDDFETKHGCLPKEVKEYLQTLIK